MFKTNDIINALINVLHQYKKGSENVKEQMNPADLSHVQMAFYDFFMRNGINVDALIPLLRIYKTENHLIQPIGLIVRSILSDFLTTCYLLTFDAGSPEQQAIAIANELSIFERDFIKGMKETWDIDREIHQLNPAFKRLFRDEQEFISVKQSIKGKYLCLFKDGDAGFNLKNASELRETTDDIFFKDSTERTKPGGSFIAESYKFDRMKEHDFGRYALAFQMFKYFSQYQHYSSKGMELISDKHKDFGFYYLVTSIDLMLIGSIFQIRIIYGSGSEHEQSIILLRNEFNAALENIT